MIILDPGLLEEKRLRREVAEILASHLFNCSGLVDQSTGFAAGALPHQSFVQYRRMVGRIMGLFYLEVLQDLFAKFPDLEPSGTGKAAATGFEPSVADALAAVREARSALSQLRSVLARHGRQEEQRFVEVIDTADPLLQELLDYLPHFDHRDR